MELTQSETIVALKESPTDQDGCFAGLTNAGESMGVARIRPGLELYKHGKYRVILQVSEKDGVITYGSEYFESPEDALKFLRDKGVSTFRKCLRGEL